MAGERHGEQRQDEARPEAGAPTPPAASLRRRFLRDGYLALRQLWTPAEVDDVNRALDEFLESTLPQLDPALAFYEDPEDSRSLKQVQRLHEHAPFAARLATEGKLPKLARELLDEPVTIRNVQLFRKPPHSARATPPHQDGEYFLVEPPQALTLWLALDPVDTHNGCLRYVRGSHRDGLRPHEASATLGFSRRIVDWSEQDVLREVAVPARPGDLIAHHAMTIHRAELPQGAGSRRALGFIYYGASAVEDIARLRERRRQTYADWRSRGLLPPE